MREMFVSADTRRGRRVGLALGGGVARGYAHLGVLAALQVAGIPIDVVAGTSAGAIMGALYCAGFDLAELQRLALTLHWWDIARPCRPWRGLVTFAPLERWLRARLGDIDIRDLKIPFAVVATDLYKGEPVVFREGKLAPAVRASCSVPGIVAPVARDGMLLCDGGVSDNLPVSAARLLGADFVIGVNLFDPLIARPANLFSTGFAAVETMVRRAGGGLYQADCLINPDLIGATYLRFSRRLDSIEKGRIAAALRVDEIRQALAVKPSRPEPREQQKEAALDGE